MSAVVSTPISTEGQNQLSALAGQWSADQQLWASGFLAGMAAARAIPAVVQPAAGALPQVQGTVLYGSQTGNAQVLAEQLAASGLGQGLSLRAVSMADYAPARLKKERYLLVLVSTHGEGDPPDDAQALWDALADADGPALAQLHYGVLALGDSSYANFCQTGRDFDERLAARGAQRLLERVECDLDYAPAAEAWSTSAIAALAPHLKPADAGPTLRAVPSAVAARFTRKHPFSATVEVNQKITADASDKDVRHLELSLEGSGIAYAPGDSLAVVPRNRQTLVEDALAQLALDGDQTVDVDGEAEPLRIALARKRELTRLTRPVLARYAEHAGRAELAAVLQDSAALSEFLFRYQVLDLLREFPASFQAQQLVDLLAPVAHRAYSIASAQSVADYTVHLTVAKLAYTDFGRPHIGAASQSLADLAPGDPVDVFLDPNPRFRLPDKPDTPIIMIGPGTGVAPYRAFLQEREAQNAAGDNWLFFGDRHFSSDFLYQIEWLRWRKTGLLNRLSVAFSRDGEDKVYVQQRMREQGTDLFAWLQRGAVVYVCGDAKQMAPDVHQALLDVIAEHGGLAAPEAADYLQQMLRSGRYRRDVY